MPPPPNNNQYDDLERIQMQANQVVDESLESTRRMIQLVEESSDAGAKTLEMLHTQGEQLDRIEGGMDQINNDMKEAEKNLQGMEKCCCGLCIAPWKRNPGFKEDTATWKKGDEQGKVVSSQPQPRVHDMRGPNGGGDAQSGPFIQRITGDAREDEMEDNMAQVSNVLGNLRNMAIDMGSEIGAQNKQLDQINAKALSNESRISNARDRTDKILKK